LPLHEKQTCEIKDCNKLATLTTHEGTCRYLCQEHHEIFLKKTGLNSKKKKMNFNIKYKKEWNRLFYKMRWEEWIDKIVKAYIKHEKIDVLIEHVKKHINEKTSESKKNSTINLFIIYSRVMDINLLPPKDVDYSALLERLEYYASKNDVKFRTLEDGKIFINGKKV